MRAPSSLHRSDAVAGSFASSIQYPNLKSAALVALQEILANVAPKKANWDLKRELAPKLAKLERRMQRALIEILQEEERKRLEEEGIQD